MTGQTISVVIPCKDMARFLGDAVASILRQEKRVDEIVVVRPEDDLDTAEVCEVLIADGAPIVTALVHEPGPGAARNVGIRAAKGDIIAFLDADDLWLPDKLAIQLARLGREPEVDIVGGLSILFDRLDRDTLAPSAESRTKRQLWVNMGTMVFRRAVFDKVGLHDTDYLYAEDVDFLLRARDLGVRIAVLQDVVLYYRQHRGSMMRANDPRRYKDLRKAMLGSAIRRKRMGLPPETEQFLVGQMEPPAKSPADWGGEP